jgi:hypothetical protein
MRVCTTRRLADGAQRRRVSCITVLSEVGTICTVAVVGLVMRGRLQGKEKREKKMNAMEVPS